MTPREDAENLSKPFAHRLAAMMRAELVTSVEYMPWADAIIMRLDKPPAWLLDLTVTNNREHAIKIVNGFVHSEPFEPLSDDEYIDELVAASFLRYERREISWATFLNLSGRMTDTDQGRYGCEYFYEMLDELRRADFGERSH
jgi:hypothetical protein